MTPTSEKGGITITLTNLQIVCLTMMSFLYCEFDNIYRASTLMP